jgi:hypothetical protein
MKDAEMPAAKNFQITQVDLPIFDKHGNAVKGAYLTTVDISGLVSSVQKKTYLSPNQSKAMECLVLLEVQRLKDHQTHAITSDEWRESMKEHGVARNRFWDAVNALVGKGMAVEVSGGYRSQKKGGEE